MVKLVLYIQPIPREQWEQIWASALLKGWRINLMCMFWWWWGKPDYLEETLHTKRPQWDGKLGPSCCWPLCYFEKQIFSNTHKSHFYCVSIQFLLLSSSSSSSSTSLRGETAHQSCDMFAASELIQISHHQVFLSPSTIIFFNQSFMIWCKHDYCLRKRWTGFLLLEAEVAEIDRHNSPSLVSYNQC